MHIYYDQDMLITSGCVIGYLGETTVQNATKTPM